MSQVLTHGLYWLMMGLVWFSAIGVGLFGAYILWQHAKSIATWAKQKREPADTPD